MSLLTDVETKLASLGLTLEDDGKALGALLLGAITAAGKAGEVDLIAAIPGASAAMKQYAKEVVGSIAKDAMFKQAVGSWKFGTACARVASLVVADFPLLAAIAAPLLQVAVETAVQGAAAAFMIAL